MAEQQFKVGSRWSDSEGRRVEDEGVEASRQSRTWVVAVHPDLGDTMMRLEGQDDAPLWHTIAHVTSTFGPLRRYRKPRTAG